MPFDEQVDPADYKDIPLLESAIGRPFQTFGGDDLYPSVPEKAAVLFHSLVCNHCFKNGNKRTAVIAVDFFLANNGYALAMSNQEVYDVATATAKANEENRKTADVVSNLINVFSEQTVPIAAIDANSEAAKAVGPDRVQRMIDRLTWLKERVEKLMELYQNR